jgi:hypothetical protein
MAQEVFFHGVRAAPWTGHRPVTPVTDKPVLDR